MYSLGKNTIKIIILKSYNYNFHLRDCMILGICEIL